VGLTVDGAKWLVERGIQLVGTDYLSVVAWTDLVAAHRILLGSGMVLLEGLDLSAVAPGDYHLVCLPLRVVGGDGAPARAVLIG
jgi:arylformamidase